MKTNRGIVCGALLALGILVSASAAWACSPAAQMGSISPTFGPPLQEMTVSGKYFSHDVEVHWASVNGPVLGTAIGPSFSIRVTVPEAAPGLYYVIALGRNADGSIAGKSASTFKVTGTTAPAAASNSAPAPDGSAAAPDSSPAPDPAAAAPVANSAEQPATAGPDSSVGSTDSAAKSPSRAVAPPASRSVPASTAALPAPALGGAPVAEAEPPVAAPAGGGEEAAQAPVVAEPLQATPRTAAPGWDSFSGPDAVTGLLGSSGATRATTWTFKAGLGLLSIGLVVLLLGAFAVVNARRRPAKVGKALD